MTGVQLKVCGITERAEVDALAGEAVDLVGLWYGVPDGPADLPLDRWRELAAATEAAGLTPVLVTFAKDAAMLGEALADAPASWVQLHGYQTPGTVRAIKKLAPDVKVLKVLHVRGDECVEGPLIGSYEKAGVDVFLFDAVGKDGQVGSTGEKLDVAFVAGLADKLSIPFLLAGGISGDNHAHYEALASHPLFMGIDVDTNARGADGKVSGPAVHAIASAWKQVGQKGDGVFTQALVNARVPVIMEVKRHDGNGVPLMGDRTIASLVEEYVAAGAPCISVVTGKWFGGDESMLDEVASLTDLPILKKDFITRESQVRKAKERGASAILLTAKIMPAASFPKMIEAILEHELTPFVEVVDADEMASVVHAERCIVAINNKDIKTQERDAGDLDVSRALLEPAIATGTPCPVSASGISDPRIAAELIDMGFKGLLIGAGLMLSGGVREWVDDFERHRAELGSGALAEPRRT
jgi:indole-3-glycerol phosphate synthase